MIHASVNKYVLIKFYVQSLQKFPSKSNCECKMHSLKTRTKCSVIYVYVYTYKYIYDICIINLYTFL